MISIPKPPNYAIVIYSSLVIQFLSFPSFHSTVEKDSTCPNATPMNSSVRIEGAVAFIPPGFAMAMKIVRTAGKMGKLQPGPLVPPSKYGPGKL